MPFRSAAAPVFGFPHPVVDTFWPFGITVLAEPVLPVTLPVSIASSDPFGHLFVFGIFQVNDTVVLPCVAAQVMVQIPVASVGNFTTTLPLPPVFVTSVQFDKIAG